MQIGIFSNGNRNNKVAKLSYDEDLKEIIVADRLGMTEAWISEHGTFLAWQAPDQLPCADLMICKAAALTRQIRMGPGIRPVPFFHPLQLATDAALLQSVRHKLESNRPTCPLFNADRFRSHLEAAYTTMWERYQRGEGPRRDRSPAGRCPGGR